MRLYSWQEVKSAANQHSNDDITGDYDDANIVDDGHPYPLGALRSFYWSHQNRRFNIGTCPRDDCASIVKSFIENRTRETLENAVFMILGSSWKVTCGWKCRQHGLWGSQPSQKRCLGSWLLPSFKLERHKKSRKTDNKSWLCTNVRKHTFEFGQVDIHPDQAARCLVTQKMFVVVIQTPVAE